MEIRPFDFINDSKQFCLLYNKVYGGSIDGNYVKWKFLDNPSGKAFGFGAWDGEVLAGFVALTPYKFIMNGFEIMASQGADTMVLEEYRGRGLFAGLTNELLDEMNLRQWYFRYSAPGKMSYPGYIKRLKHQLVSFLPYWVKIRPGQLLKNKLGLNTHNANAAGFILNNGKLRVSVIKEFTPEYDDLWKDNIEGDSIAVIKSTDYLNWRYSRHPLFKHTILECRKEGRLAGYAVLRDGNMLELQAGKEEKAYACLIKTAEAYWGSKGCVISHGWFIGEPLVDSMLKNNDWLKYNYKPRPLGLYPAQPLICYVNPGIERAKLALKPGSWRFSMGDVDCM